MVGDVSLVAVRSADGEFLVATEVDGRVRDGSDVVRAVGQLLLYTHSIAPLSRILSCWEPA